MLPGMIMENKDEFMTLSNIYEGFFDRYLPYSRLLFPQKSSIINSSSGVLNTKKIRKLENGNYNMFINQNTLFTNFICAYLICKKESNQ